MSSERVAVLGAGSWGTVLADKLAHKGHDVTIWAYESAVAQQINSTHTNNEFLPGAKLHASLRACDDLATAVTGASCICSVVPSHVSRKVWSTIAPRVNAGTRLVCASKGIEA